MKWFRIDAFPSRCIKTRPVAVTESDWIGPQRAFRRLFRSSLSSRPCAKGNLRLLNKSLYDTSLKCNRLGWYARRNKLPSDRNRTTDLPKDSMKEFLVRQGIEFERYVYAHKYGYHHHPASTKTKKENRENHQSLTQTIPSNLAIVHEVSPIEAAEATNSLMNSNGTKKDRIDVVLQPTFLCGNRVARADVAVRTTNNRTSSAASGDDSLHDSWEILEIKSSTEKSFRKKVPDLAYTVSLARSAGYRVSKASLILVNPNYVRGNKTTGSLEEKNDDTSTSSTTTSKTPEPLLYKTIDCTELVDDCILDTEMEKQVNAIDTSTSRGDPPPVNYKLSCGKCELLGFECGPISSSNSNSNSNSNKDESSNQKIEDIAATTVLPLNHGIWELPRLSQKHFPGVLKRALPTLELSDLDLAPDESSLFLLTKNQLKFFHAVATDCVVVDKDELHKRLWEIANTGPCTMYLDFEAVSMLHPPYPGMVPYEAMITQYSLHKQQEQQQIPSSTGNNAEKAKTDADHQGLYHSEYLSNPQRDCRKDLLEQLLNDLGYDGVACDDDKRESSSRSNAPILVYSSYEKTQLKKLATMFPEHSKDIADVIDRRLVDLEKIIKDCVSHPGFRGRSSIKVTLPALVPGFEHAYQNLLTKHPESSDSGIADGGTASAAFADLISGVRREASEVERTRNALLEYCKLDTLALVEIHKALWKLLKD